MPDTTATTTKKWWASRTIWANLVAAAGLFLANQYGFTLTPDIQAGILAGVNIALRIVTKTGLE